MKKVLNIKNIGLLLTIILISALTLNTKEVKATGTVTWNGPSSITIRETVSNIVNPIIGISQYNLYIGTEEGDYIRKLSSPKVTITYSGNETISNYQIQKTAVLDLTNISDLPYQQPGDYTVWLNGSGITNDTNDPAERVSYTNMYYSGKWDNPLYKITISIRNVVDANNIPTGDFTASLILEECEWNDSEEGYTSCSKVSPVSGILYADIEYKASSNYFGHIELSKTVKGIGADTTKYFPLTITINNDDSIDYSHYFPLDSSGYSYSITGLDSSITYNGSTITNPTAITDGTPTTIYLKHGQTAIIGRVTNGGETFDTIPVGSCAANGSGTETKYGHANKPNVKYLANIDGNACYGSYFTVEENPSDYTASFSVKSGSLTTGYYVSAASVDDGANTVDFVNTKEMSVVTGIVTIVLPFIIIVGISIGGIFLIRYLRNNKLASN